MDHENAEEKLSAFHDSELSVEERRKISEHLKTCADCRGRLNWLERMSAVMSQMQIPESSERFVNGVMDRLARLEEPVLGSARRSRPFFRWLLPAIGYAIALLLVFVAITYREPVVNAETVLLAGTSQDAQWIFSSEVPDVNKLLVLKEEA